MRKRKLQRWRIPEYGVWTQVKRRCYSPKSSAYANYGGRGIRVCNEWLASFEAFYAYMGTRPVGYSLDHIDVNGHYEPGNVRWASHGTQARNKRNSKAQAPQQSSVWDQLAPEFDWEHDRTVPRETITKAHLLLMGKSFPGKHRVAANTISRGRK